MEKTESTDEEPIPISALQHWVYCPRQCALIHLERIWAENRFTAEGQVLHLSTNKPGQKLRKPGFPRWITNLMTCLVDSAIRINAIPTPQRANLVSPGG